MSDSLSSAISIAVCRCAVTGLVVIRKSCRAKRKGVTIKMVNDEPMRTYMACNNQELKDRSPMKAKLRHTATTQTKHKKESVNTKHFLQSAFITNIDPMPASNSDF